MTFSYKKTAATVLAFTLVLSIIVLLIYYRNPINREENYVLKEYNDTVALFKGKEILSVYDEIVLSTFPAVDRQKFIDGISVNSIEDAEKVIEDFDG